MMMNGSPSRRERSRSGGSPRGGGGLRTTRRSYSRSRSRSPHGGRKSGGAAPAGGGSGYRRSHRSRSGSRGRTDRRSHSRSPGRSSSRRHGGGGGSGHRVSPHETYARPAGGGGSGGGTRGSYSSRNDSSRNSRVLQENPGPNKCLGVFGLSLRTTERDLREVFSRYGPIDEVTVVIDAQTGRSRGFSFIYFENIEDAKVAKEACNGIEIDGRRIRVDFSITQRAHTPTPGIYMGKPSMDGKYRNRGGGGRYNSDYRDRERGGGYGGDRGGDRDRGYGGGDRRGRSPSPSYRSSRRERRHSRSRSYSPRYKKMKF